MKPTRPEENTPVVAKRNVRGGSAPYAFMRSPGAAYAFEVGDAVEALCDHEKASERVRGWLKGVVVQVDNKMVAVQFRSNVFLTDGWMVPDRILWYPTNSDQIRPAGTGKKTPPVVKKDIPDY
jgi:TusA-related sulfurtransferase